jgi:microcystin-dependent protein
MTTPFLSEIRIMAFNFAPRGWALCNGQILPVSQNQPLASLLKNTYGGDGQTTFGLPNLQGRTANHVGTGFVLGQAAGESAHTLTTNEVPSHTHTAYGSSAAADSDLPAQNYLGAADNIYAPPAHLTAIHPSTVTSAAGGQAHNNMQPYLVLNFCIALSGIFPTQN